MRYNIILVILFLQCINFDVSYSMGFYESLTAFFHEPFSCFIEECCHEYSRWMPMNMSKLNEDMDNLIFGQHLVKSVFLKLLKSHIENHNPKSALLLSFNGMTGIGKNYVAEIMVKSFFKEGMKSKFVHFYSPGFNFPLEYKINVYKEDLKNDIIRSVKQCPRSIFIFDDVHNMQMDLIDTILPFVESYPHLAGVDYRKSIFILLSNSYGKIINTKVVDTYSAGKERESITLDEMEKAIMEDIYKWKNEDSLRKCQLMVKKLITAFVPFLPLEKKHVWLCIKKYFKDNKMREDYEDFNTILKGIEFTPYNNLSLSVRGCKNVESKIKLLSRYF